MREFRQEKGRTSKPQVWMIERNGNQVTMTWGQLEGKMQETTQEFEGVNIGKKNEKEPIDVAQEWMKRQILLRTRKGYREVDEHGEYLDGGSEAEINFDQLPENLRFYKPVNSMNKYIENLAAKQGALFIRKRNGNMFVVCIDSEGYPHLYSSTLQPNPKNEEVPWLDRFPHFEQSLTEALPPRTILLCELVANEHRDNLDALGSVLRSLTETALEWQEENERPWMCVWDVAFYDGRQLVGEEPIEERLNFAIDLAEKLDYFTGPEIIDIDDVVSPEMDQFDGSLAMAMMLCKEWGWEGWVVVDPAATYGDRAFTFHGKAERPKECVKLKPLWEMDMILRWDPDNKIGTRGKGKKSHGVGAFFAYLCDENGEEHFISKVGGGLTDEDVTNYAVPGLCMVGQVEFSDITKGDSLQFPRFVRERHEKQPEECLLEQIENIKKQIGGGDG